MTRLAIDQALFRAIDRVGTADDYADDARDDGYDHDHDHEHDFDDGTGHDADDDTSGKHWTLRRSNETEAQWLDRLNHPPGEAFARWSARQQRQRDWLNRIDALCGLPRVKALTAFLGSDVALDRKTAAVAQWCAWATNFLCSPCLTPTPEHRYEFWFSGASLSCLHSHIVLIRTPEWAAYQRELTQAREDRRPPRDRAQEHRERRACAWLDAHRDDLLNRRKPNVLVQARKRLDVLGFEGDVATYFQAIKRTA